MPPLVITKGGEATKPCLVSVIIPSLGNKEMLQQCVDSINSHTNLANIDISKLLAILGDQAPNSQALQSIHEIIVVNQGVDYDYKGVAKNIVLDKNIGYGPACNLGAKAANGIFLSFINDDMLWTEDTYYKLLEYYIKREGEYEGGRDYTLGLISPKLRDHRFGMTTLWFLDQLGQGHPKEASDWPSDLYTAKAGEYVPIFFIRKDVFSKIGGFDPQFSPFNYEDVDLNYSLKKAGYKVGTLLTTSVEHKGGATILTLAFQKALDIGSIVSSNRAKLRLKWGTFFV